jgi:hypothetical protein
MAAHQCWLQAKELAIAHLGGVEKEHYPCTCDHGKTRVSFSTWGSTKPATVTEMTCFLCKGTGYVSLDGYISQFIGCKCSHDTIDSYACFHASDGHAVFGNDTYICGTCGMVTQFG